MRVSLKLSVILQIWRTWRVDATPRCDKSRTKEAIVLFVVTLDRDEDGVWVAECPSIPGCVSQGQTKEDAVVNMRQAIRACLEVRSERGIPLTVETRQLEVGIAV